MAANGQDGNAVAVSDLTSAILDPVLRRRAGISVELVQCWQDIVGARLADLTRPEKLVWPRRRHEDDPFAPATLVVACEGAAALRLQHETDQIIARLNAFLGFVAVGRVRILQKPVAAAPPRARRAPRPLTGGEEERLARLVGSIDDENLRASLRSLGRSVLRAGGRDPINKS